MISPCYSWACAKLDFVFSDGLKIFKSMYCNNNMQYFSTIQTIYICKYFKSRYKIYIRVFILILSARNDLADRNIAFLINVWEYYILSESVISFMAALCKYQMIWEYYLGTSFLFHCKQFNMQWRYTQLIVL